MEYQKIGNLSESTYEMTKSCIVLVFLSKLQALNTLFTYQKILGFTELLVTEIYPFYFLIM